MRKILLIAFLAALFAMGCEPLEQEAQFERNQAEEDLISVCKRNQLPIIGCAVFADANNY